MLRILHREYGDYVRVVGMADGSGCAPSPPRARDAAPSRLSRPAFFLGPLRVISACDLGVRSRRVISAV